MLSEEAKVMVEENNNEPITVYNKIPYALINAEIEGSAKSALDELTEICKYYKIYKKGARFSVEGSNADYVPATLRYKMAYSLINKEARFLFAEAPDIIVEAKGDLGLVTDESKNALTVLNDVITTVLGKNNFEEILLKAAKDCFIGKRVACLVNFNEIDGVTVTFLPSTQFVYETRIGNDNVLTKFVCFIVAKDSKTLSDKRIFKKKFTLEDNGIVYLEETMYDGTGVVIDEVTEYQATKMKTIPAAIFINDGLTGETEGESEIRELKDYESWYAKLANSDIDAGRKSMNPTKYVRDMDSRSTQNLSTAPGALWDLGTDQNLDNPSPAIGMLEPAMNYSSALQTTMNRIKSAAYEQVDMPNIVDMQAKLSSGKELKAIYWPLIVRCKEKMKMWGPQLQNVIDIIIQGAMVYPNCFKQYTEDAIQPVAYEIKIAQNLPLPEDEAEEKQMDLSEVDSNVMSKKAYMKKWRGLTDQEADEELEQMALERQLLEESSFGGSFEADENTDTENENIDETDLEEPEEDDDSADEFEDDTDDDVDDMEDDTEV